MNDHPEKTYQYRHLKLLTQWLHYTFTISVVIIAIIMAYFSFFAYFLKQMTIDPEKTLEEYRIFANFLETMNNKENLAFILLLIALTFLLANIILTFILALSGKYQYTCSRQAASELQPKSNDYLVVHSFR